MRAPEKTFGRARALRDDMSLPEIVLWQVLRKRGLSGLRFRRQHPVGPYILDFYCPAARLAIEVEGLAHDTARNLNVMSSARRGSQNRESGSCAFALATS
jgi:very-short-patch-repair endonuclease